MIPRFAAGVGTSARQAWRVALYWTAQRFGFPHHVRDAQDSLEPNQADGHQHGPTSIMRLLIVLWAAAVILGAPVVFGWYYLGLAGLMSIAWDGQSTDFINAIVVLGSFIVLLIVMFKVACLGRPRLATIFISYPHEEIKRAAALVTQFSSNEFNSRMVQFIEKQDAHNEVISEVVANIRSADLLVVVTASVRSNDGAVSRFYEAEILAATVACKPVILLGRRDSFRLPGTAYDGYPVLDLDKLDGLGYDALVQLARHAVGTRSTIRKVFVDSLEKTFAVYALLATILTVLFGLVFLYVKIPLAVVASATGNGAVVLGYLSWAETLAAIVLPGVIGVLAAVTFTKTLISRLKLRALFREEFAKRHMSHEVMAKEFSELQELRDTITCLLTPIVSC